MKLKVGDLIIDKGMKKIYKGDIGKVIEIGDYFITIKWIYMKFLEQDPYVGVECVYSPYNINKYIRLISKEEAMVEML